MQSYHNIIISNYTSVENDRRDHEMTGSDMASISFVSCRTLLPNSFHSCTSTNVETLFSLFSSKMLKFSFCLILSFYISFVDNESYENSERE